MDLTDEQWKVLEPLIGQMLRQADGRYGQGIVSVSRSDPACHVSLFIALPAAPIASTQAE
jgi:hypothetical protein